MRFSRRTTVGPSIFVVLGLIAALMMSAAPPALAHAAGTTSVTYTGTRGTVARTSRGKGLPSRHVASARPHTSDAIALPYRTPAHSGPAHAISGARAPQVSSSVLSKRATQGQLLQNFNALSDVDQRTASGFHFTPPDQGLCAGNLGFHPGGQTVLWELVNEAAIVYAPNGTPLSPIISLNTLFNDPGASGDIRCFYDTASNTFFFSEIGTLQSGPDAGQTATDLAVINANGNATYQIDTSFGGQCFGDQPHIGFDAHGFFVSTDEFCGPLENNFIGALLFGLSKSQLVALDATINMVTFGPLSLASDPILTLEPAFGFPSETEFLLNSFPFDQFGNSNSIADTLGFWQVKGDRNITTGHGAVTLTGRIISSETYAFPVPAASTGTGAVTCEPSGTPPPCGTGQTPITSEKFLNPDDSRLLQVQLVNDDRHGLQLYAALDSAVNIANDPSARDGAAWFVVNPNSGRVTDQGFVAVSGAYLLYPAILHTHTGTTAMAFTITSPTLNPSTAFVVRKSSSRSFGAVQISAIGSGPHVSFSDVLFGEARWGDYSAEELDPNGLDIWSASEYIPPPPAGADKIDNWGTEVWEVAGAR